jgi:hypothetical protein
MYYPTNDTNAESIDVNDTALEIGVTPRLDFRLSEILDSKLGESEGLPEYRKSRYR